MGRVGSVNRDLSGCGPGTPDFRPVRVLDVDIGRPLQDIPAIVMATGRQYGTASALVRLHTHPLGLVELTLRDGGLSADDCARQIWHALGERIVEHLRGDGAVGPTTLTSGGLPAVVTPTCLRRRMRMLARAPRVSVVVVTRDRPVSLAACLRSLLSLDYPYYDIVVVDNAPSSDATAQVVRQLEGESVRVRYVREDRPGVAIAHNRGLAEVTAPIVAYTDDDVLIDRHWLAELVSPFVDDPHVGCVTGLILPLELETPSQLWIEQFGGFSKGFTRRTFDLSAHRPGQPLFPYAAGTFGSGANMAFRTTALRAVGGFDVALGTGSPALGGEDLHAFFQTISRGYALVYQPAAIVRHRHYRDYERLRKQVYGYGVGLTAYLASAVFDDPRRLLDIVRLAPRGLAYAVGPRSPKNRHKRGDYPRELTGLERRGMIYGPLAYARSLWNARLAGRLPATVAQRPAAIDALRDRRTVGETDKGAA